VIRLARRFPCAALYIALLVLTEAAMIKFLVLPYPSTRNDWLFTIALAAYAAGVLWLPLAVLLRIAADIAAIARSRD
jgi:hypothetical protein